MRVGSNWSVVTGAYNHGRYNSPRTKRDLAPFGGKFQDFHKLTIEDDMHFAALLAGREDDFVHQGADPRCGSLQTPVGASCDAIPTTYGLFTKSRDTSAVILSLAPFSAASTAYGPKPSFSA